MYWTNPFRTFDHLHRLFDEMDRLETANAGQAYPRLNAWRKDDGELLLTAEVPGMDPDKLEITVHNETLTIEGELPTHERTEGETYHRNERRGGKFRRVVNLPHRVDPNKVEASCQHGILRVKLQKPEEDQPRRISVNAA